LSAQESEDKEVRDVAKEILKSPEIARKRDELQAEDKKALKEKVEGAKKRLQNGRKVFQYKMVYLPAGDILDEDLEGDGFDVPALTEFGLEGWEVVNIIPRRRQMLTGVVDDNVSGAYFLLKREMAADEAGELDKM
jgi:hypothetical protein